MRRSIESQKTYKSRDNRVSFWLEAAVPELLLQRGWRKTDAVNLVLLDRIWFLWKQRVQPTLGK